MLWPYVVVAVLLVALVGTITVTSRRGAAPAVAPAAAGVPLDLGGATGADAVDLSAMTPVERFDRLFDRVMRASEGGDAATVTTFGPMALAAFESLGVPDADARFHAGLIRMATGDLAGAKVLAASISAEQPRHLFGILLKGRIAEQEGDRATLEAARRAFVAAYPAESAAQRPEYPGHQVIIDRFLAEASR